MAKARLNVKLSSAEQKKILQGARGQKKEEFCDKLLDKGLVQIVRTKDAKIVRTKDAKIIIPNDAKRLLRGSEISGKKGILPAHIIKRLGTTKSNSYYDAIGVPIRQYDKGTSYIIPTEKGLKLFGYKAFLINLKGSNGQVMMQDGKSVLRVMTLDSFLDKNLGKIEKKLNKGRVAWEKKKGSLAGYREERGRASRSQLVQFNQLRGRLSQRVSDALFKAGVHSQKELLDIIGRNVGWRNLTGNAYTGLVSMLVIRTNSSYNHKYIKSVAEHQGKRKRATRTMFSTNGKRGNYSHFHKGSRMPKRMWIGLRYDKPDSYFFIADKGQMHTTEKGGRYAYNEALDMLNEASNRLNSKEEKSERYITLRIVSGAEYIEHMNVKGGQGSIMDLAREEAQRLVKEKLKASLPDIVK